MACTTGTNLSGEPELDARPRSSSFCQSCESRSRLGDSRRSGTRQSRSLLLVLPGDHFFHFNYCPPSLFPVLLRLAPAPLDCHDASTSSRLIGSAATGQRRRYGITILQGRGVAIKSRCDRDFRRLG